MAKDNITFSCLIPAYNEEGRVGKVVKIAKSYPLISEVIVVSDGSTDKTAWEAKASGADVVIELKRNFGKGGAIFMGAQKARSDYLILLDADLINLNHNHLTNLIEPILNNVADMTIGVLADDRNQKLFPALSGQRVLKKELILNNPQLKKSRFQLELLLNQLAQENKLRVVFLELVGINHLRKRVKYKFLIAVGKYLDAFSSFFFYYFKKILPKLITPSLILLTLYPIKGTPFNLDIISPPASNDRILVIAAHPDDETIGLGGYLTQAIKNGAQVKVVIVTNGEGNKYYAYLGEGRKIFSKEKFRYEEEVRTKEAVVALGVLGLKPNQIIFVGFPDRGLDQLLTKNWSKEYRSPLTGQEEPLFKNNYNLSSKYRGEDLEKILKDIVLEFKPNKIFTHSFFDKHPDHRAVNRFVAMILSETNFPTQNVYTFLIHYNNFSKPWNFSKNDDLLPPKDLQNRPWLIFNLNDELINKKEIAIRKYKSQLKSPYLNLLLKSFIRKNELFLQGVD